MNRWIVYTVAHFCGISKHLVRLRPQNAGGPWIYVNTSAVTDRAYILWVAQVSNELSMCLCVYDFVSVSLRVCVCMCVYNIMVCA